MVPTQHINSPAIPYLSELRLLWAIQPQAGKESMVSTTKKKSSCRRRERSERSPIQAQLQIEEDLRED